MRLTPRVLLIGKVALGTICLAALWYGAWPHRRRLLELVGFDPGSILFDVAISIAALTVAAAWADIIAKRASSRHEKTPLQYWIWKLFLRSPIAILLPLMLCNALLLILTLGLVKGQEIMVKQDQSTKPKTTILFAGTPVMQISLGRNRHIERESGFAFTYPVPRLVPFEARTDNPGHPTHARTVVLESATPIGPAHTPHEMIRKTGLGTFENGRTYSLEYVIGTHPALGSLIVLLSVPLYVRAYLMLLTPGRRLIACLLQHNSSFPPLMIYLLGLCVFFLPLFAYWETGKTTYSIIGGLLPWSDASDWLHGTYHLLNERSLFWWTARRPISPAFMSFLASIAGEDLRGALVFRTVLAGIASLLVAAEMWQRYGAAAGIGAFAILLAFVSPFTPTTLTESLGLAFGATAFAMMWQAISKDDPWRFASGLFLLTLAMSVRPGPVLVLPLLAVWAALNLKTDRRSVISRLVLLSSSGVAALVVTSVLTYFYGTGESFLGANYAFTFYGLAFGGKSWEQFFLDYPLALSLSESAQSSLAYQAAFAEILRNPSSLVTGLWAFGKLYVRHLFLYIEAPNLQFIARALAALGISVGGYLSRRDPHTSFLLWGAVGIVLSAPFLFWASDAYRAFISTAPFDAAIVALGLATLRDVAGFSPPKDKYLQSATCSPEHDGAVLIATTAVGASLVLGCTLAPVAALALYNPPRFSSTKCDGDLKAIIIHLGRSSPFVEVVANKGNVTQAPQITFRDFHADRNFANVEIKEALREISPGSLLIHGYDLSPRTTTTRLLWMIASVSQMPKSDQYYLVCGSVKRFPAGQENYPITFVESAREIMPIRD